jgi:NhaA family Na+:H+ antiporter
MSGEQPGRQDHDNQGIYHAPWERAFDKLLTPFEEFIHKQTTTGLLLMGMAVVALLLANTPLLDGYLHLVHLPVAISFGDVRLEKSLNHWVNDGLMTLFFFLVGLELKREMLVGELAVPRNAMLPIIAAIGGMVVPALLFYAFNVGGDAARGWGIPMATDIAFAIGALVLLAGRVPQSLITFLVALAIVDDLGAVVVIALFYTEQIVVEALLFAGGLLVVLLAFNRGGIRHPLPYFLVGTLLWFALLKSGVHATLAGVITAFTIPARPKYDPGRFSAHVKELMHRFDSGYRPGESIMTNDQLRSVTHALELGVARVEAPLQRLERALHMPVAYLVIPLFALINAGIPIDFAALGTTLSHPVMLGVAVGLVAGKFIGITAASWLALRLGIGRLPAGTRFAQIAGVGLLGGIGFTMAIFIAELGFEGKPDYLLMAKTGILLASLLAGLGGLLWLYLVSPPPGREES